MMQKKKKFSIPAQFTQINDQRICYRLYTNEAIENDRKLVLLHGAGVAGEDTWSLISSMLSQWRYILIPDLRGMGQTFSVSNEEQAFSTFDLVSDLEQLAAMLRWDVFDLAGYSLGGLVAMLYKQRNGGQVNLQMVLEPGLLDRYLWKDSQRLRQVYAQAAMTIREGGAERGVRSFLDTISPQRKTSVEADNMAIARLMTRHLGFANALDCVNQAAIGLDREQLIQDQGQMLAIIGGLSVEEMHRYHQHLSESYSHWQYLDIPGTDHSLPYQKPRQIARAFNQWAQAHYG